MAEIGFTPLKSEEQDIGFTPVDVGFTPAKDSFSLPSSSEDLISDIIHPFKRWWEITDKEVTEGLENIFKGLQDPAGNVLPKLGKIGLGAVQTGFAPLTGLTRSFIGEPTTQTAQELGASPELAGNIGTGAEIASTLLLPTAITKLTTQAVSKGEPFLKKALESGLAPVSPSQVLKKPDTTNIGGTNVQKVFDK